MKIFQIQNELKNQIEDQIDFLVKPSETYDEGFTSEAKIVNFIKALFYDT